MSEDKKGSPMDGREIPALVLLLFCASWYKYGRAVKAWFFDNMTSLILGAIGLLALGGYVIVRRYQKKNEAEIARLKKLNAAQVPSAAPERYYRKPEPRGFRTVDRE